MNTLDVIVIAIVTFSGLFALVRGFVREVLSIAAWIAAAAMASYGFTPVQPYTRHLIQSPLMADLVTGIGLFLVSLLVFSMGVGMLSDRVRTSGLGPIDRALGLAFGVARGALLLCVCYLVASRVIPEDNWPSWVTDARTRPLLAAGAASLQALIPHEMMDEGDKALNRARKNVDPIAAPAGSTDPISTLRNHLTGQTSSGDATSSNFDRLRLPPKASAPVVPPGYGVEQTREMTRAIEQMLGSGEK